MARGKQAATKPRKPREPSEVIDAKHRVFADAILEGHSESDAARAAGYHPSNARNVMRQEEVQQYLEEGRSQITDITTIKRLDVLNIFMEAVDMARTLADPAQMISGAKEIGKMMGFYEPETIRIEAQLENGDQKAALASKIKGMTDEELMEIAFGRAKLIEGEIVE